MLETPVPPTSYSLRVRSKSSGHSFDQEDNQNLYAHTPADPMADMFNDDDDGDLGSHGGGSGKSRSKSRRELPAGAVSTLKAWLLSPEHFTHPYPTPQDQAMLMQKTGIDKKQLKNWFTNARRRIWKPMLKKQIEQGKLSATGAPGVPGAGIMLPAMPPAANGGMDNPHSIQAMRTHYQQAQQQAVDVNGNPVYEQVGHPGQYFVTQPQQQQFDMTNSSSIGTLPQLLSSKSLNKTDSHAVLMELFARDQDLVRQATESARLKSDAQQPQQQGALQSGQGPSQHPMKAPSQQGTLANVPSMNSWPHFSSITSLNNLGTIPGVKSITSLSGADLASKGNVNKMGNLAQVKSMESMGKNDSYAFLEVFFGDRSSISLSGMAGARDQGKGMMKQGMDEDNEIGLSLEDESSSQQQQPAKKEEFMAPAPVSAVQPAPLVSMSQDGSMDTNTLKRAYDDALAARGLISVSRSCERLTDLALPAKIQRTLSQEFVRKQVTQNDGQSDPHAQSYEDYAYTSTTSAAASDHQQTSHQYPGQQPGEPRDSQQQFGANASAFSSDPSEADGHVQVPSETKCALCSQTNVDTQLRPCGHMFHERCLKPSLTTAVGPPKCPCDDIPMQSALLAIPTDGVTLPPQQQQQDLQQKQSWVYSSSQSVPAQDQGP